MVDWIQGLSATQLILLVVGVLIVLAIGAGFLTRWFVLREMRAPWFIRLVNRGTDRVVGLIKRPITIAVLDEVADVIQTGHYTKNISDALLENRLELKQLVAEKVRQDPSAKLIGRLPGYDTVVDQVSETTIRVLVEMLGDPRMDELVSDLLRNNIQQIRTAVRARQHESGPAAPPS